MFPSKMSEYSLGDEWGPLQCCSKHRKSSDAYRWSFTGLPVGRKKTRKSSKSKIELLTGQQRLVVLRTWHMLSSDIPSLGISTMSKMLELDQRAKGMFDFFAKTGDVLLVDRQFRQHAFWLIQAVSAVVENLDRLDDPLEEMFVEIGEKHAAIPQFTESYFKVVQDAWSFVWEDQLKERYSAHTSKSWEKVFRYIVDLLLIGFKNWALDNVASLVNISATYSAVPDNTDTEFSVTSNSASETESESEFEIEMAKFKKDRSKKTSNAKKMSAVSGKGSVLASPFGGHAQSQAGPLEGSSFDVDHHKSTVKANDDHDSKQQTGERAEPSSGKSAKHKSSEPSKQRNSSGSRPPVQVGEAGPGTTSQPHETPATSERRVSHKSSTSSKKTSAVKKPSSSQKPTEAEAVTLQIPPAT